MLNHVSLKNTKINVMTPGGKPTVNVIPSSASPSRVPVACNGPVPGPNIGRVVGNCYSFAKYAVKSTMAFGGLNGVTYAASPCLFDSTASNLNEESSEPMELPITHAIQDLSLTGINNASILQTQNNQSFTLDVVNNNLPKSPPTIQQKDPSTESLSVNDHKTSEVNLKHEEQHQTTINDNSKTVKVENSIQSNETVTVNTNKNEVENKNVSENEIKPMKKTVPPLAYTNKPNMRKFISIQPPDELLKKGKKIEVVAGMSLVLFPNYAKMDPSLMFQNKQLKEINEPILKLPQISPNGLCPQVKINEPISKLTQKSPNELCPQVKINEPISKLPQISPNGLCPQVKINEPISKLPQISPSGLSPQVKMDKPVQTPIIPKQQPLISKSNLPFMQVNSDMFYYLLLPSETW